MKSGIEKIRLAEAELNRIIRGKPEVIHNLLIAFVSGGNILLDDVPGVGKTTLAKALARLVDAQFSRIQFTPDLLPADIIGTNIYNPREGSFQFRPGPVFTNILLADEINRASPRTQSALLECMCEHQVSFGGISRELQAPFMVIATQNPIEFQGTYPLPEAQLDRFMFKLRVSYPSRGEEAAVVNRMAHPAPSLNAIAVAKLDDIMAARELVDKIYIDEKIIEYILDLVIATRPGCRSELSSRQQGARLEELDGLISFGASPRASIALALAARGAALLEGRAYVLPQDVKEIAPDVLRHRIVLSYEAEAENIDSDTVIQRLLAELRTP